VLKNKKIPMLPELVNGEDRKRALFSLPNPMDRPF
jgi:hypothetical protein